MIFFLFGLAWFFFQILFIPVSGFGLRVMCHYENQNTEKIFA